MEKSAAGDRQPKSALACAAEKLIVLVTAQARIVIKVTDRVKHPAMNHEANSRSGSGPPDPRHFLNEIFGVGGQIVILLSFAHGRANDIELLFLSEAYQPFQPSRRQQNVVVEHD